jgi:dipeptidyl aminopeptidase/acylaminoacyl peptidase
MFTARITTMTAVAMSVWLLSADRGYAQPQNMSVDPAWLFVPEPLGPVEIELTEPVKDSEIPVRLMFVELIDGVYAPIGLRTPPGPGPFPTVVFAHMNGGLGLRWVREWTQYGSWTLEEFLAAGYAVAWMRYRAEVDTAYGSALTQREFQGRQRFNRGPLEYEDAISIIEFIKTLPEVDSERVGYMSVSHGSEMLMKIASEYHGLAAAVATEPASGDYLARRPSDSNASPGAPEPETMEVNTPEMQRQAVEELRSNIDLATAMQRINAITTPILVVGRDRDHNQATFRLNYELLHEAGKVVEWRSYDHDDHGFVFVQRNVEGLYDPDPIQREAVRESIAWFDRFLKGAPAARVIEHADPSQSDWVYD